MRLQGTWKKKTAVILATVLMGSSVAASAPSETEAAKKVSLTPKKISVGIGQIKKLKLKNNKKKVKWSIVSGKKRIKLKAKKKTGATVVGKKPEKQRYRQRLERKSTLVP